MLLGVEFFSGKEIETNNRRIPGPQYGVLFKIPRIAWKQRLVSFYFLIGTNPFAFEQFVPSKIRILIDTFEGEVSPGVLVNQSAACACFKRENWCTNPNLLPLLIKPSFYLCRSSFAFFRALQNACEQSNFFQVHRYSL